MRYVTNVNTLYIGTLELDEMLSMFNEFGFDISEKDLWKLFSIVNEKTNGKMTLEEFKQFM
jgi:Ca2+-binding EF-hand superfamily protein